MTTALHGVDNDPPPKKIIKEIETTKSELTVSVSVSTLNHLDLKLIQKLSFNLLTEDRIT